MRAIFAVLFVCCSLTCTATLAAAQCQLATDNPPQQEAAPPTDQLDLSLLPNVDPFLAEQPQIPPLYLPLLFQKALELARGGDYETAARIYQFMLKVQPQPIDFYNLACIYSLLNKPELATAYLEKAVQAGWTNLPVVDTDQDFNNVRENAGFKAKLAELRQGQANAAAARGSLGYATASLVLPYRLRLPDGFDPAKQYDLVLALHGAGDSADNFDRLWTYFQQPGFILATPQAPYAMAGANGPAGRVWFGTLTDDPETLKQQTLANEQYLLSLIEELRASYAVRNVYLLGFSQGAVMAYATALHNPGGITGIVVFGGALPVEMFTPESIAAGSATRVFIAHGREDNFENAQSAFDQLAAAGYDVKLEPYDGGHYINLTALHAAQAWLSSAG